MRDYLKNDDKVHIEYLRDSDKLTPKERQKLKEYIRRNLYYINQGLESQIENKDLELIATLKELNVNESELSEYSDIEDEVDKIFYKYKEKIALK